MIYEKMDLTNINKVASRKRMNAEAEKLRDKVSRETAKIIKLKVAQDTAYWDLKEKLQQVESNHEKLQQNMVEVQMQHEAISGQYQEELRLRPDTLNKVSSTREICGVLQEYSERLRDTLARCTADQAALSNAYQRSGQLVRELRARHADEDSKNRNLVTGLQEKVQLMTEHQNQLVQLYTAAKQQADTELGGLRRELSAAAAHQQGLLAEHHELNRKLDLCKFDIDKKEELNVNLQEEIKKLMQEFTSQTTEARTALIDRDREIKEMKEENQSLKKAVENQDIFIKSICEQKNVLQEKIAVVEDEHVGLLKTVAELKASAEEAASSSRNLQNNITVLNEEKQILLQQIEDAQQVNNNLEGQINNLQAERTKLECEKVDVINEFNKAVEDSNDKTIQIEKIAGLKDELANKVAELEVEFKNNNDVWMAKNEELNALIKAKDTELDSKACTINQLMSELKISTEIRSKLEGALQKIKKEIEIERDSVKEKEKTMTNTIGKLETAVRDKDGEISKQLSIILEMRNEKERLQEKIQRMQNTIDNIQKELARPPPHAAASCMQPELDDNAVMLTPSHKKTQLLQPQSVTPPRPEPPQKPQAAQFATPRAVDPDTMLYSLFSDSSMEGDSLDVSEVNRRFNALARGERLSPAPLAALKRRSGVPAAQGGLRHKPANNNDSLTSLSQIKNELKNKERTFFKNKKLENKAKKGK